MPTRAPAKAPANAGARVSVLLVHYNCMEHLGRAVRSVITQTFEDWELVILDDNTPGFDTTWKDPRITVERFDTTTVQRGEQVRYSDLFNHGIVQTRGELITYLSADDFMYPDRLERMVAKIDEGHHWVYGPQALLSETGDLFDVRHSNGILADAWHQVDLNSVMHTRESFMCAGAWPTHTDYWLDADGHYWRQLHKAGFVCVPVDGAEPTDCKTFRKNSVTDNILTGKQPWDHDPAASPMVRPSWVP